MKFYSVNSVGLMSGAVKKKWIWTKVNEIGVPQNKNVLLFIKFKHKHPFVLQLFDFIFKLYTADKNRK